MLSLTCGNLTDFSVRSYIHTRTDPSQWLFMEETEGELLDLRAENPEPPWPELKMNNVFLAQR